MMQTITALLAFGAIAALGLWWGVRRDDERRGTPPGIGDGDAGFPLWYGNAADSPSSSWADGNCDVGDSGGGDCGGGGGGGD